MVQNLNNTILVIAGLAKSLINFRGDLLKAMVEKGYVVHVAAPFDINDSDSITELENWGLVCHTLPLKRASLNPFADLILLFSIISLLRSVSPDILLTYTIKPVLYGNIAARFTRVRNRYSLVTGLGYAFTDGGAGWKRSLVRRLVCSLYGYALANSKHIFFQNPDDKNIFSELGLLDKCQSVSIVNGSGVDVDKFNSIPPQTQQIHFLMIARLLVDKGVREYVEAARIVKLSHKNVIFSLLGSLDENPNSIKQNELTSWIDSGVIQYIEQTADVRPYIAKCSVYVLPSYREGTPRTVLEAMAMNRPIITTDAPGCRETVLDGENGFLVPVKSTSALVDAVFKFINEPELIPKMAIRSRQIAEEKYDVHKVNAIMLNAMGIVTQGVS